MENKLLKLDDLSIEDIINGYSLTDDNYKCLICGYDTFEGNIYNHNNSFADAKKTMVNHICASHGDIFNYLISMDKKVCDLTDQQKNILLLFYNGFSDSEISEKLGGVTQANVRNFRYYFQKKKKQAKIFLAIMELFEKNINKNKSIIVSNDEKLKKYYKNGKLIKFPKNKEDRKLVFDEVLNIAPRNESFTEKEINDFLKNINDDYALLRRELVENEYLFRKEDGSLYWFKPN